jgi:hypothetical protein
MIVAALITVGLQAADVPLVVNRLVTGPMSRVQLTNTSPQAVTAWRLAITAPAGVGRSRRFEETVDAYLSELTRDVAGSSDRLNRLMPGETRELSLDPQPEGASVEVVAVVLDDGTAAGDPQAIREIFERRARERDELRQVVDIFNAVLPSSSGIPALEELKTRFGAFAAPQESTPHRAAREAVDSYLRAATASNADAILQRLRDYAALVQRQYELAVRHSQPRGRANQ